MPEANRVRARLLEAWVRSCDEGSTLVQAAIGEIDRLEAALQIIAAFEDAEAGKFLAATGSYAGFDEPGAVETARETLAAGR